MKREITPRCVCLARGQPSSLRLGLLWGRCPLLGGGRARGVVFEVPGGAILLA